MFRWAFVALSACSTVEGVRHGRKTQAASVGSEAENLWQNYVNATISAAESKACGLQPGCVPQMHANTAKYRGAIMLLHGFTACPQQFERLIPLLTKKGFTVFTPVNPGHGRKWKMSTVTGKVKDYLSDLPTKEEEYYDFAREMHAIMMAANGEKVLFGMSVGGGIAAWQGYLDGYDRRFLAAPMILAAGIVDNAISLANRYPWRRLQMQSWGEDCEIEREAGRAGICQFNAAIGAAARNVGQKHSYTANKRGANFEEGGIQIVFVDDDPAVSTNAVINLAIKYGMNSTSKMICGMPAQVGHSFLSPYDNPNEDKYWLKETTLNVANYLTDGVQMPQGDGVAAQGYPRCQVRCKPGAC